MASAEIKDPTATTQEQVGDTTKSFEADDTIDAISRSSWCDDFCYDDEKLKSKNKHFPTGTTDQKGSSYNHIFGAIMRGDVESVKMQIESGVYIDCKTRDGYNAVVVAILEGQVEILRLLLEKEANVNNRIRSLPPLVHALMKRHTGPKMMRLLLDHGAILNAISGPDQKNALHWAASEGKAEAVEFLLDHGADIEAKCSRGRTPLILAAEAGHEQVAKVLCTHGANLNTRSRNGGTCLTWAACRNHVEVLEFLLAQKVDIEAQDNKGHTALSLSAHFGHLKIVEALLAHDPNTNTLSKLPRNCTPAMAAVCSNRVEVLNALIAHGCDLTLRSAQGDNVLEIAIHERQADAAKVLLEAFGGKDYPKESVALEIALANGHSMIQGIMRTASIMYSYMEVSLGGPSQFAWMDWVLRQGGELVKPLAMVNMLHTALEERDLPMIRALAHHGCDVNRPLESGHTPLSFAVGHRKLEMIQVLLDAGADPNMEIPDQDGMNYTPFDHAIIELKDGKDTEVVDVLLQSGRCRINKGRDPSSTAFSYILGRTKRWSPDVANGLARRMIDSTSNVNEDRDDIGCTLLHVAVHRKRPDIIEYLLERGANMEATADFGYTPFILACQHSPSMLPVLIENGANVHASYKSEASALHAAAAEGNLEALEFLIGLGMDMEKQTLKGYTPLACSLTWGQEKVALALLKAGADATWTTRQQYQTALHFAASNGMKDAVVEILKQPVQVNARDKHGWTALNEVCTKNTKGTLGIVSALLDAGANIELPHPNGDHPLHIALANENEEVAELLIDRGASITALGSRSRTPLHIAADLHLSSITYRLLSANVTTEAIDSDSWTPLCCVSYAPIAHQLIKHGANVNYADRDGWTPLHQAVYHGDVDVARILVMEGADVKARTMDDGLTVLERADDVEIWGEVVKSERVGGQELRAWVGGRKRRLREERLKRNEEERAEMLIRVAREEERAVLEAEKRKEEDEKSLEGLGGKFEVLDFMDA